MSPSRRPYLIRAIHQWCSDNGHTPHIMVAADYPGANVPTQYVQDGRITLNISYNAVRDLHLDDDLIWFSTRFAGRATDVQFPPGAVLAIFARENGEGVMFGEVEARTEPEAQPAAAATARPTLSAVSSSSEDHGDGTPPDDTPPPPRPKGRPTLRVIK
ncbi:ClpXP protease specificity-enhancing factor [Sinimarinibacterium sp. NLF-5-8]|uniref:ClpXP protease specificity-enhancing factor n=1 Tax=Sinimarinibacterium sp. NLF-5-8 TaxID=2698684 RepID=UPI00137BD38A|nr:ClpXP protease specificity-enhancing factor [Sinimarinibacterium sp. NLF-5-8]QHS09968.1 ClpXP protease specificity-enhancing factor [Sinimarinibacterium sp. NLF-5-8]